MAAALAAPNPGARMRAFLIVAAIVVLAATGAALALGWEGELARRRDPVTVDAYVDGERTPLSSHLSGYVRRVLVRDNQLVHAGETILEMVDDDYRASVAQAEAQADAARAALAAAGAAFLHPLAKATQVKHILGPAAHAARAFELAAGNDPAAGDDHIKQARILAPPAVVEVLRRYPAAPPGGGRAGELIRQLDASLR